ncbi:hypothetical protein NDU88_005978 [Pleurodeles waltl]|uniref:Uncharacterized protein n=1 Tax=Pleurodeles waltl TaxID=8319 RepID=A0AAV7LTK2_PLEWA|nr:hypothetical protein NDU88_005978 [Pleurodeles waltl]
MFGSGFLVGWRMATDDWVQAALGLLQKAGCLDVVREGVLESPAPSPESGERGGGSGRFGLLTSTPRACGKEIELNAISSLYCHLDRVLCGARFQWENAGYFFNKKMFILLELEIRRLL